MSERTDTLARQLVDARTEYETAKKEKDRTEAIFKDAQEAFWDHLDEMGQTTGTWDLGEGYGQIQFQKRETIRGIVRDPERAAESLTELGLDEALLGSPQIRQRALSEHVRDWLASGQKIPEGLDFNPTRYVSISRK